MVGNCLKLTIKSPCEFFFQAQDVIENGLWLPSNHSYQEKDAIYLYSFNITSLYLNTTFNMVTDGCMRLNKNLTLIVTTS